MVLYHQVGSDFYPPKSAVRQIESHQSHAFVHIVHIIWYYGIIDNQLNQLSNHTFSRQQAPVLAATLPINNLWCGSDEIPITLEIYWEGQQHGQLPIPMESAGSLNNNNKQHLAHSKMGCGHF